MDFDSADEMAKIVAGSNRSVVNITVIDDNIVEGDEMFNMSLTVPSSLSPGVVTGSVTSATGIIMDSSTIRVRFTQEHYNGSEDKRFIKVTLRLNGGTSSNQFNVIVTPSEQSPVSAEGNSVMCMMMC